MIWMARILKPLASGVGKGYVVRCLIEADRYYDARAFALMLAGGNEILSFAAAPYAIEVSWTLRWAGSPMNPKDPLRLEASHRTYTKGEFRDVREISFGERSAKKARKRVSR